MRVAQIAPLYEDVPPRTYGGTERVIAALCDGLVARGHDVTLFATGGSRTDARLESVIAASLRVRMDPSEMSDVGGHLHLRMLADVYQRASDFDVIHSHIDLTTLPFVESSVTPTVLTLHGRLDTTAIQRVLPMYPGVPLVSISDHQREAVDGLPVDWIATVPNGLDLGPYHGSPAGPVSTSPSSDESQARSVLTSQLRSRGAPVGRCALPPRSILSMPTTTTR